MKRYGDLFELIASPVNISCAEYNAAKGKRRRPEVIRHEKNAEREQKRLLEALISGRYRTSRYSTFKLYEPKERLIFKLPYFPDRITHHAILNICEPVWYKLFISNTYACIKGRGIHACLKALRRALLNERETAYCLKLDIHKFYPSIDHNILKAIIRRKIKDVRLLQLLDEIIDSADGVPIGNYLSQFFANLYLTYFDHWVKEVLGVRYYFRYADDIVILAASKEQLWKWFYEIQMYLYDNLRLTLKKNWQVFPVEKRGIDFVGYVVRHKYTLLRKSIKIRMFGLVKAFTDRKISYERFMKGMNSYFGWLKYCNSKNLLKKVQDMTGVRLNAWLGEPIGIRKLRGKCVYLYDIVWDGKYFTLYISQNHIPYKVKTQDHLLVAQLSEHCPGLIKL